MPNPGPELSDAVEELTFGVGPEALEALPVSVGFGCAGSGTRFAFRSRMGPSVRFSEDPRREADFASGLAAPAEAPWVLPLDVAEAGLKALLPVEPDFSGASAFASLEVVEEPVGMALLPVGPDLRGCAALGLSVKVFKGSDPAAVAEDLVASLPLEAAADAAGPGLSGSEGLAVDDAAAVALAETALLPAEPGFAGEALGVAEAWEDALLLDAGFGAPVEGCGVLGDGVAPALAFGFDEPWDEDGLPAGGFAAPAAGADVLGLDAAPGLPCPEDGFAASDGRSPGALPWSFDAVTGVSSPLDISAPAPGYRSHRRRRGCS